MAAEEDVWKQQQYVRELYMAGRRRHMARMGRTVTVGDKYVARWDGGTDGNDKTYKPVWPKVVEFCTSNGLDPSLLVRAVFDNYKGTAAPPPLSLCGPAALALYRRHNKSEELRLKQSLIFYNTQADTYHYNARDSLGDEKRAWVRVLCSDPPTLSELYRYCLCVKLGFSELEYLFYNGAFAEYFWTQDAYDQEWREWIPESLRATARAARSAVTKEE